MAAALIGQASWAEAARKEPGVVVYVATQPDLNSMVTARELASTVIAQEISHSSEIFGGDVDLLLAPGAAGIDHCPSEGASPQIDQVRSSVLGALIRLDHRAAIRSVDRALLMLPCLDSLMGPQVHADLNYYRGVALQGEGDEASAREAFGRTLAVDPRYPGDPNFPPEINEQLESLRQKTLQKPTVDLQAYVPPSTEVRINGRAWDPQDGPSQLPTGEHLVQFQRDGLVWSAMLQLKEGNRPVLLLAQDQDEALLEADLDRTARDWTAQVLGLTAADAGVDLVALVLLGPDGDSLRYLYRPSSDRFSFESGLKSAGSRTQAEERAELSQASERSGPGDKRGTAASQEPTLDIGPTVASSGRRSPDTPSAVRSGVRARSSVAAAADRVRLQIGAGYAVMHPFSYLQVPLDLGVRLVRGLFVEAGVAAAVTRASQGAPTVLPNFGLGLSYRLELPTVQPRFGARLKLALDATQSEGKTIDVRVGWAGLLGADVLPPRSPLFFGICLEVGMAGSPFWLAANASLGMSF